MKKVLKNIMIYIVPMILFVIFIANAQYFIDDIDKTYNPIFPVIKFWGSFIVFTAYFQFIFLDLLGFLISFFKLFLSKNAILKIDKLFMKLNNSTVLSKLVTLKVITISLVIYAVVNIIIAHFLIDHPSVLLPAVFLGVIVFVSIFVGIPLVLLLIYISIKALYLLFFFNITQIKPMIKKELSFFEIFFEH